MKSFDVERRQRDVLALAGHPVVEGDRLLVAEVRSDEVGVVDPAVVDVAAGLHLRLDLLDHVAFLDEVVVELDAGDLGEGLGEGLRLVFVRRDRLGDDVDLHAGEGLRGVDEPLHLLELLVLRERRGLELAVDPAPRLVHAGEGRACASIIAAALAPASRSSCLYWQPHRCSSQTSRVAFDPVFSGRSGRRIRLPFAPTRSGTPPPRREGKGRKPTTGPGRRARARRDG